MHLQPFFLRLASPELAFIRRLVVVLLWLAALAVVLAGCATHRESSAGDALGRGIRDYCDLPRGARELVQAQLDRSVAPNRVAVICAADVEALPDLTAPASTVEL